MVDLAAQMAKQGQQQQQQQSRRRMLNESKHGVLIEKKLYTRHWSKSTFWANSVIMYDVYCIGDFSGFGKSEAASKDWEL